MKLYAISDLHLDYRENRQALLDLKFYRDDWIILAGDISSKEEHLHFALDNFCKRFDKVFWVPGNHDLWSSEGEKGVEKYLHFVEICRSYNVYTPEDSYETISLNDTNYLVAPLFLLYDYSFRPDHVSEENAVAWAMEEGILCADESKISPAPFGSKKEWCRERIKYSEQRLSECDPKIPIILINHYPLRQDLIRLRRIPRFVIWCGTQLTESWHRRFNVAAVITGHLHTRSTDYRDFIPFEEVSFGYPRHWRNEVGLGGYLREILPGPSDQIKDAGPFWKF